MPTSSPQIGHTAVRRTWESLPDLLRHAITHHLGSDVAAAAGQTGGFTPGLATVLRLATGSHVFVKAVPADHPLASAYQREADTVAHLPDTVPAPRLRWHRELQGWHVLVFDAVPGRHPDLSPGSDDIGRVLDTVTQLPTHQAPDLPASWRERGGWLHGWATMGDDLPPDLPEWVHRRLPELVRIEKQWIPNAAGDTLVHGDLRPDNLIIYDDRVLVVDWSHATCGAPWQDIADLIPHMIMAGCSPGQAQQQVARLAAWQATNPDTITAYAAAFAGYWLASSSRPAPPSVPHLRGYQRIAGAAALRWLHHRWTA